MTNQDPKQLMELVRSEARRVARRLPSHVELDELVSLGSLGVVEATQRFRPDKGVPFEAYARFRIRGAIRDGLRKMDSMPRSERRRVREGGGTLDPSVTVQESDRSPTRFTLIDHFPQSIESRETWIRVILAIAALPAEDRELVIGHYLDGHLLKDLGEQLGVSESRICQRLRRSMRRVREALEEPGAEHRYVERAERVSLQAAVVLRRYTGPTLIGEARNISRGGVFVCTEHDGDVGELVQLELIIDGLWSPLAREGIVRWRRGCGQELAPGIGLAFREPLEEEVLRRIDRVRIARQGASQ